MIRRIQVNYRLCIPAEHNETAERVHAMHARYCPVARTIGGSVAISTELVLANKQA